MVMVKGMNLSLEQYIREQNTVDSEGNPIVIQVCVYRVLDQGTDQEEWDILEVQDLEVV